MNKEQYNDPSMDIVNFDVKDIIVTSDTSCDLDFGGMDPLPPDPGM